MREALPVFPANYRRRLHYYETGLDITSGTGTAGTYFFQANGAYDPNITGVGHQPMGFDQIMLFFTSYTVVASEVLVTAYNTGTGICRTAVFLKEQASASTNPVVTLESGLASCKLHYPGNTGQYASVRTHTLKCDVRNYFARSGSRRSLINDDTLKGTVGTNPAEGVYYGISVWDPRLLSVAGVYFDIYIVFDIMFSEPRMGTLSDFQKILSGTATNLGPVSASEWKSPPGPPRRDELVLRSILKTGREQNKELASLEAETFKGETGGYVGAPDLAAHVPGGFNVLGCEDGEHDGFCHLPDHDLGRTSVTEEEHKAPPDKFTCTLEESGVHFVGGPASALYCGPRR
jgi:hypothetical protein